MWAHHALGEVVGVNAGQQGVEEGQHVAPTLRVPPVTLEQASGHEEDATDSGNELVRLGECVQGRVSPETEEQWSECKCPRAKVRM